MIPCSALTFTFFFPETTLPKGGIRQGATAAGRVGRYRIGNVETSTFPTVDREPL